MAGGHRQPFRPRRAPRLQLAQETFRSENRRVSPEFNRHKDRRSTAAELIEQAGQSFAAGATLVLVEAAELVIDGQPNTVMLDDLSRQLDMARVMIELPGPWIPGVRTCDIEALKKLLVGTFGPDVNVANVSPDTVIDFEATRTGLGVAGPLDYRAA